MCCVVTFETKCHIKTHFFFEENPMALNVSARKRVGLRIDDIYK